MRIKRYPTHLLLDALLVAVPGALGWAVSAWQRPLPSAATVPLIVCVTLATLLLAIRLRRRVNRALHTASNLLAALRAGDTGLRATAPRRDDPVGELLWEINTLSATLRAQRLRVREVDALLAKVVEATDIAIFAFDKDQRLRLVNPAGAELLAKASEDLIGRSVAELQLDSVDRGATQIALRQFPGASGRFEFRRRTFRDGGIEHELISVSDLSRALREEERQAWQRLIRVLGHEINNSLAPIKSIAATLAALSGRPTPPEDWREDLKSGLSLIGQRADALARFLLGYAALARLPPPQPRDTDLGAMLRRAAGLEQRLPVSIGALPAVIAYVDGDQIEQCVINLLRNAVDACLATRAEVKVELRESRGFILVRIEDSGPGLAAGDNLFVPFFTTKQQGCGIGLVLARQIAEAHGGTVTLENRPGGGCVATLTLPRSPAMALNSRESAEGQRAVR